MKTKHTAFFSFHGLLGIVCKNTCPVFTKYLMADFKDFAADHLAVGHKVCITIDELNEDTFPNTIFRRLKHSDDNLYITGHRGKKYVVVTRHGKLLAVFSCKEPFDFYYKAQPSNYSETLNALLVCMDLALTSINAMLCKGAVASCKGKTYVFSGLSGTGKTSLLLQLLRQGWNYTSDNTFILFEGKAYSFRHYLVVHHYHIKRYPQCFSHKVIQRFSDSLYKQGIRQLMERCPVFFDRFQRIKNMGDPYIRLNVSELGLDSTPSAIDTNLSFKNITTWVFLLPGQTYRTNLISMRSAGSKFLAIQQIAHTTMDRLCHLVAVHCDDVLITKRNNLWYNNSNEEQHEFYLAQIPSDHVEVYSKQLICDLSASTKIKL